MPFPASGGQGAQGLGGGTIYVGQNGNDSYDGSSWALAMKTGYAAYAKLISLYGRGVLNVSGSINWGGPVANQGIWLRGDGATIPGWLPMSNVVVNGYGQSADNLFQRPGCAIITAGATGSVAYAYRKKPGIWLSKSQQLMTFNNIKLAGSVYQPFRVAWDYFRNSDGTIQSCTITGATRTANVTTYTVTLPTGTAVTSFSRASNVVSVTIPQPAGAATFPPWRPGQIVRVNTGGDTDFPNIDIAVSTCNATLESSADWSITYIQAGADHAGKAIANANVQSHGCGATGEGEYLDLDSPGSTDFPATQYKVTGHTVTTVTVADPWGGQPNATGGTCPASATGTTIGTLVHQERVYASVQQPVFNNVAATMPAALLYLYSSGPCFDFGANISLGPELYTCQTQGFALADAGMTVYPRDDDRMACVFQSCGSASNPVGFGLRVYNSSGADGGIRVRTGANGGLVDVQNWVGDIGNSPKIPPAVDVIGNGYTEVNVDYAIQADNDLTVPNVRVTNTPPNQIRISRSGLVDAIGLCGDRLSSVWSSTGAPDNPWVKNQIVDWASLRISGNHPAGRRTMGPIGARYLNKTLVPGSWTAGGGVTVTGGHSAPDGTLTATKIIGVGDVNIRPSAVDSTNSFEVGGRVVMGGWFNADSGFGSNHLVFQGVAGQITFAGTGDEAIRGNADYAGNGWQFMAIHGIVATIPGGATQTYLVKTVSVATAIYLWGMFCFYVPAAVKDNDFYEFLGTLKHQPVYLPAGYSGTMEGQKFIGHGGLGSGLTYVEGVASGQLTIVGSFTPKRYEPKFNADGTIRGWFELLDATINP